MSKRILIVEDNEDLTEAIEMVLHKAGYEPLICRTYNNIFSCLFRNNVDLVILDGYLNGYDGRQILQQLKQHSSFKDLPVIFASVMTDEDLTGYKPDATLPKVYGMNELLKKIHDLLPA
ncbi:response regulator transcription factor [Mucilaginibacter robiniae]|uniref:Response regulator transcription factor n=1 Tax=Mucilaginibacter robiniae TaxID=2728022 RepID=A0A7L5E8B3_9SPHI|nr:response regulator [Mucilaginibacter robiniae]QJD97113.1 response regulator transcription factor [Mucilaginibacter robiniae]